MVGAVPSHCAPGCVVAVNTTSDRTLADKKTSPLKSVSNEYVHESTVSPKLTRSAHRRNVSRLTFESGRTDGKQWTQVSSAGLSTNFRNNRANSRHHPNEYASTAFVDNALP